MFVAALPVEQRLPIISHWGITGGEFARLAADALRRVDLAVIQTFSFIGTDTPIARRVLAAAKRLYGIENPGDIKSPVGLAHAYDLTHLLARAIVHEPRILLCDEPTAGLDPITSSYVTDAIRIAQRAVGVTSLVIASDLRIAFGLGDQLALLHQGKIAARGTPEELSHSRDPAVLSFIHEYLEQVASEHQPVPA